jgi:hypothetical protein
MEKKRHQTVNNGVVLDFHYDEENVIVHRNHVFWGRPQGDAFTIALLEDIEKLKAENEQLKSSRFTPMSDTAKETFRLE